MKRKKIVSLFFALFILYTMQAQRHEIGIQLGASNLVGDIGKTNFINPFPGKMSNIADEGIPFYVSLMYRMNFNPYQTLRFNLSYSHIQFNDLYSKEYFRRQRKLWGQNSIYEGDVLFEYNLFPVNNEQKSLLSPYIFGGISGMLTSVSKVTLANDFNRTTSGVAIAPSSSTDFTTTTTYSTGKRLTMAIPCGVGLKYKFNYQWAIFGEFMFRPTFSDAIDYSVVNEKDLKQTYNKDILEGNKSLLQTGDYLLESQKRATNFLEERQVGNINSKDWVNSLSIGISYSFGRPPCYCQ